MAEGERQSSDRRLWSEGGESVAAGEGEKRKKIIIRDCLWGGV